MTDEDRARVLVTRTTVLGGLAMALALFRVHCGRYPTTQEGLRALLEPPQDQEIQSRWRGPYVANEAALTDPWARPLRYICPGQHNPTGFDLSSAGPDGVFDTADDINNW